MESLEQEAANERQQQTRARCYGQGVQVTKDTEKAKVLNVFFALDFTIKICLQASQARGNVWNKKDLPGGESD